MKLLKINIAIKSKHQISYENSDVPSQLSSQFFGAIHALAQDIYCVPKCKANVVIIRKAHCLHDCIYTTTISVL